MLRKLIVVLISLTFCFTTVACGSGSQTSVQSSQPGVERTQTALPNGKYPVQQVEYNDVDGVYTLMLLNTQPGTPPVYRTENLQMARLTEEQVKAGEKSYLGVENNQPVLYLTEDFRIAYVHNVTETRDNPQTGRTETVVVRQESSFWTPFAGAFVGSAIANTLFTPHYYVPPVYQPGGVLVGYGGYGRTYNQAVSQYRTRYNSAPAAVTNRQTFRSTGSIRTPSSSTTTRPSGTNSTRSTGSGVGGTDLRSNPSQTRPTQQRKPSFGSGGTTRRPSFSGGSRRRR